MSEWWFNAVSVTEAIFTARTCYQGDQRVFRDRLKNTISLWSLFHFFQKNWLHACVYHHRMKPKVGRNFTSERGGGSRGSREKWKIFHFIGFKVFLRRSLTGIVYHCIRTFTVHAVSGQPEARPTRTLVAAEGVDTRLVTAAIILILTFIDVWNNKPG